MSNQIIRKNAGAVMNSNFILKFTLNFLLEYGGTYVRFLWNLGDGLWLRRSLGDLKEYNENRKKADIS